MYVVLHQDLWLNTSKVSQEGYTRLCDAQAFCKNRLGMYEHPNDPALHQSESGYVFSNGVTKDKYTIVEVTV